jgi:hypothetical protein
MAVTVVDDDVGDMCPAEAAATDDAATTPNEEDDNDVGPFMAVVPMAPEGRLG